MFLLLILTMRCHRLSVLHPSRQADLGPAAQLDWRPILPRIRVPCLNLIGRRSAVFPWQGTELVGRLVPACRTVRRSKPSLLSPRACTLGAAVEVHSHRVVWSGAADAVCSGVHCFRLKNPLTSANRMLGAVCASNGQANGAWRGRSCLRSAGTGCTWSSRMRSTSSWRSLQRRGCPVWRLGACEAGYPVALLQRARCE